MPVDARQYEQLVQTYATQQASILAALVRALLGLWMPFSWVGKPAVARANAAASAVHVSAATAQARRLSRAFMLQQLRMIDAAPANLPPIEDTYERGGTPINEVYYRPARQVEWQIYKARRAAEEAALEAADAAADAADLAEREQEMLDWLNTQVDADVPDTVPDWLVEEFEQRLETIASDDIAATARDEAQKVMAAAPKVIGYRRVIHPEFSKNGSCGLCVVASSRFYTKFELMPLHGNCKCTVAPFTTVDDPGLKLNDADLKLIYSKAGSTYAEDLKRIVVTVQEHGELGPILRKQGDQFKDVTDVNVDAARRVFGRFERTAPIQERQMWRTMREQSEQAITTLENALRDGRVLRRLTAKGGLLSNQDLETAIAYHQRLIARATGRE